MRRASVVVALVLVAAACGGEKPAGPASGASAPSAGHSVTPPTTVVPSPASPSAAPPLPAGTPPSYDRDVPAAKVPPQALIPDGTHPDGTWTASTPVGDVLVVAFASPSPDPFRQARGFVVWRRFTDRPPWRPVFGVAYAREDAVLAIQALTADVTGDGSPDALVRETTGGSGDCARWLVVDLQAGAQIYGRDLCDARIDPSLDPAGLTITQAVYKPGDAHCCPSAVRTTVLTYEGGDGWVIASRDVTPT